jgi:hypothetical protein
MRKLRRLPWRIPKQNHSQPPAPEAPRTRPREVEEREARREREQERRHAQPVAFAGGRYVYGDAPSVPNNTEIRHKSRNRLLRPFVPVS